ncbi:hypothetical protein TEA_001850 [Camellia sinensis var. sinensis]|uniref:Beta-galactosidase beta-sandwich domain-containing protein n=1 Tax=Camellia sinensis var. sinensis TaxID=542762 RepID=A0A4S4DVB6_CAMSN|nr:hypothetical protein TEA_001850 [Camellia sinensis var. sinensis]
MLILQITGLAFASIDSDYIYIQGVDYECANKDVLGGWCDSGSIFVVDIAKENKLQTADGDPTVIPLGNYQEAYVCNSKSGDCAAFLAIYNSNSFAKLAFGNMHYNLPPWSISILPDYKICLSN